MGDLVSIDKDESLANLGLSKYADEKAFDSVSSGLSFLPRLQLFGANSGEAKRGKIGMGRYGLVRSKDQIQDLTANVNVLVLSWRPKAMRISDDEVITAFNPDSKLFQEIQAEAGEKDTGAMFGQRAA